jgi:hypothetical protein
MSKAQVFPVENRLAKLATLPGGRTFDEAVRAADRKVESVRERCLASLKAKALELSSAAQITRASATPSFDELYRVSNAIYGIAGTFDCKGLAEAACSLCDLLQGFTDGEPVAWPAVDVHVDGIRLLTQKGEEVAEPILAGLRRVRARFVSKP